MSTPIADIIQVLYSIKCPKLVVELMFLIYRFIFMLMDVLHNMTISATSEVVMIVIKIHITLIQT